MWCCLTSPPIAPLHQQLQSQSQFRSKCPPKQNSTGDPRLGEKKRSQTQISKYRAFPNARAASNNQAERATTQLDTPSDKEIAMNEIKTKPTNANVFNDENNVISYIPKSKTFS